MKWIIAVGLLAIVGCSKQPSSHEEPTVAPDQRPTASVASLVRQPALTISCHEMLGGKPSPEPTTYELIGRSFYSQHPGGERQLISTQGKLLHLGRSVDDEGPQDSFASHTMQGDVLTRTVLWQQAGRAPKTAFVEQYDFRKQTVVDEDTREDSCNHDAPPDGRSQEEAVWQALSGTGRGETTE